MFYDKYVKLCASIKKSPSAVAEEVGVKRSNVTHWKAGRNSPSDVTMARIAEYFGVSVSYLKDEEEQKESPTTQTGSEALKEAGYYQLNEDNKKLIDQMIAQLIKSQSGD